MGVEELEPGFMAVAVPIRGAGGDVVAALGVGGPRVRLDPGRLAEIAKRLPEHAARISVRLGARQDPPEARARAGAPPRTGTDTRKRKARR
jgi:hypothetical protein